jgi:hypothetical protein
MADLADLPDPSTLTDEELEKIISGEELEDSDENQNHDDDADDDKNDDDAGDNQDDDADDSDEDDKKDEDDKSDSEDDDSKKNDKKDGDKPPSRREQRRIHQLLTKYPELDKPQPQQPQQPQTPAKQPGAMDYKEALDTDDETIKQLEADREQFGKTQYNAGLEQAKSIMFHTRLEVDAPRIEAKYPFLDKNSDKFKPEAAQDVNTLYLTLSGYDPKTGSVENPNLRYGAFVDTIFSLAQDIASDEAREITKNVKSQAAKTGLRPGANSAKPTLNLNKAPQEMTDEELKEKLKSMNIPV